MHLTALFPQCHGLHIDHVCTEVSGITLVAATTAHAAEWPICHQRGHRVHSRYQRRVTDLPCAGRAAMLIIHARRFFCPTADCPRKTFRERLPALVTPGARRSHGLCAALTEIAFPRRRGGEAVDDRSRDANERRYSAAPRTRRIAHRGRAAVRARHR